MIPREFIHHTQRAVSRQRTPQVQGSPERSGQADTAQPLDVAGREISFAAVDADASGSGAAPNDAGLEWSRMCFTHPVGIDAVQERRRTITDHLVRSKHQGRRFGTEIKRVIGAPVNVDAAKDGPEFAASSHRLDTSSRDAALQQFSSGHGATWE